MDPRERDLADKLIEALAGDFRPDAYHDEYQKRIHDLIEAKRTGKKVKPKRARRRKAEGTLVDSLRSSLKTAAARRST